MTNPDESFQMGYTSMYPILTTEAKPDITMKIICILKVSIRRKTIVGNFMVALGRKNNKNPIQKHTGLPLH